MKKKDVNKTVDSLDEKNKKNMYYDPSKRGRPVDEKKVTNKPFNPDKLVSTYRFKRDILNRNGPKKATVGSVVSDALNVPQKVMMYGATTVSRGPGKGVYDTPSHIMKEDWGWGKTAKERAAMQGADLVLDPISFIAASKLKRGWGEGLRAITGTSGLPVSSEYKMKLLKQMGARVVAKADKVADAQGTYEYLNKEFEDKPKEKKLKPLRELLGKNKGSILLRNNASNLSGYKSKAGPKTDKKIYENKNVPFVKRILDPNAPKRVNIPYRDNVSTHLMSSASDDRSSFAYPTLQYKRNRYAPLLSGQWVESENPRDAVMSGNIVRFKSDKEASKFAEGGWKPRKGKSPLKNNP